MRDGSSVRYAAREGVSAGGAVGGRRATGAARRTGTLDVTLIDPLPLKSLIQTKLPSACSRHFLDPASKVGRLTDSTQAGRRRRKLRPHARGRARAEKRGCDGGRPCDADETATPPPGVTTLAPALPTTITSSSLASSGRAGIPLSTLVIDVALSSSHRPLARPTRDLILLRSACASSPAASPPLPVKPEVTLAHLLLPHRPILRPLAQPSSLTRRQSKVDAASSVPRLRARPSSDLGDGPCTHPRSSTDTAIAHTHGGSVPDASGASSFSPNLGPETEAAENDDGLPRGQDRAGSDSDSSGRISNSSAQSARPDPALALLDGPTSLSPILNAEGSAFHWGGDPSEPVVPLSASEGGTGLTAVSSAATTTTRSSKTGSPAPANGLGEGVRRRSSGPTRLREMEGGNGAIHFVCVR